MDNFTKFYKPLQTGFVTIWDSVFKAHSIKSVSSSKARSFGISTKENLKSEHWLKEPFFRNSITVIMKGNENKLMTP